MSIEGGAWVCTATGYTTGVLDEWNTHCIEECDKHLEYGETRCTSCGVKVFYEGLPFHKLDIAGSKNISLKCEACESKTMGKVKRSSSK